jgi:asparagine synthase (glutamine-hydrolysing)
MGETLLDSGLFAPAAIERLLREHETGRFDRSQALWLLLVFEGFLAQAADASRPRPALALEEAVRHP